MQRGLILVFIQIQQSQIGVYKAPCGVGSVRCRKKKLVQIFNRALLKGKPDALYVAHGVLQRQLLRFCGNYTVDVLFVDNQKTIFIFQVLHVLWAKPDDILQRVNRYKSAITGKFIRRTFQGAQYILNFIYCIVGCINDCDQIINDFLLNGSDVGLVFPPQITELANSVTGIGKALRTVVFCLLVDGLLHIPVAGDYIAGVLLYLGKILTGNRIIHPILCQRDGVFPFPAHIVIDGNLRLVHCTIELPPGFRILSVCCVQICQRVDKSFCFFPQGVGGLLHGVIFPLAVRYKLIEMFEIFNVKQICVWIEFYLKSKLAERIGALLDTLVTKLIQSMKRFLLVLIYRK